MRIPVIAGNWKMNLDRTAAVALARAVLAALPPGSAEGVEVGIAPPYPYLEAVRGVLRGSAIWVGGQDLSPEPYGAFTGDVSAPMLTDVGCSHVIVGHSERRQRGESSELVGRKVAAAIAARLAPVLCVGETLAQRESGKTAAVVLEQLDSGLRGITAGEGAHLLVAYEPVWAIGTGRNATPAQAGEVHALLRDRLAKLWSRAVAESVRILYGGSVKPENAGELLAVPDIDGALVGGASLVAGSFLKIIAACPQRAR
ncbi:MAG: triose-phosphate isomerase [Planctomycetes bacterium]|nr:triose-phosphate isomerase [Planctomycetota bacterium]